MAVDCEKEVKNVLGETVLHFDFDKDVLTPMNRDYLDRLANTLKACPAARIVVEGNCDERGTEEYNIALGQRRASVAKEYLVALGTRASRIDAISYGFERPADPRHDEEAWAMNRRDEFAVQGEAPAKTAEITRPMDHPHWVHGRTAPKN
jgi:peptidoglycan-associated lipoprotein